MNKKDALIRLDLLENEAKELRKILNSYKEYTLNDLISYENACKILEEEIDNKSSISKQIKTIVKAANYLDNSNKIWKADFTKNNNKYFPYFNNNGSGFGWYCSGCYDTAVGAPVGFYFKNSSTCELIVKRFIKLYINWIEE